MSHGVSGTCRVMSQRKEVSETCPDRNIPVPLHSSLTNFDANFGSQSLINFNGSPNRGKMCWTINPAVSSAVILSLHRMNTTALVQS